MPIGGVELVSNAVRELSMSQWSKPVYPDETVMSFTIQPHTANSFLVLQTSQQAAQTEKATSIKDQPSSLIVRDNPLSPVLEWTVQTGDSSLIHTTGSDDQPHRGCHQLKLGRTPCSDTLGATGRNNEMSHCEFFAHCGHCWRVGDDAYERSRVPVEQATQPHQPRQRQLSEIYITVTQNPLKSQFPPIG